MSNQFSDELVKMFKLLFYGLIVVVAILALMFLKNGVEMYTKDLTPIFNSKSGKDTLNEKATELKEPIPEKVKATPEPEKPSVAVPQLDYDTSKWLDILDVIPDAIIDIRYATDNNFVEEQMYECGRCFMRKEAIYQLALVQDYLRSLGYGIKVFDCYRPRPIQQKLWDKVPNASYVTPPWKGSEHNKGLAVDITIVDAKNKELEMGSAYDYFGKEAHHDYFGHSDTILDNRTLLKTTMETYGFHPIRTEWWHYSYRGIKSEISDWVWECPE